MDTRDLTGRRWQATLEHRQDQPQNREAVHVLVLLVQQIQFTFLATQKLTVRKYQDTPDLSQGMVPAVQQHHQDPPQSREVVRVIRRQTQFKFLAIRELAELQVEM